MKDEKYSKVRDHSQWEYKKSAYRICSLKSSTPKEMLLSFHNGSDHVYRFITKEFEEEFEQQFTCLGENADKYITVLAATEKEITRIDKNGE